MEPTPVRLHIYDISRGIAAQLSPILLGRQVDGLWHSTLVVGNTELSYGPPLRRYPAGRGPLGQPDRTLDLGCTALSGALLDELLSGLAGPGGRFSEAAYDILYNNCNHFANELASVLTGGAVPDYILNQGQAWLDSPLLLAHLRQPPQPATAAAQQAAQHTAPPPQQQQQQAARDGGSAGAANAPAAAGAGAGPSQPAASAAAAAGSAGSATATNGGAGGVGGPSPVPADLEGLLRDLLRGGAAGPVPFAAARSLMGLWDEVVQRLNSADTNTGNTSFQQPEGGRGAAAGGAAGQAAAAAAASCADIPPASGAPYGAAAGPSTFRAPGGCRGFPFGGRTAGASGGCGKQFFRAGCCPARSPFAPMMAGVGGGFGFGAGLGLGVGLGLGLGMMAAGDGGMPCWSAERRAAPAAAVPGTAAPGAAPGAAAAAAGAAAGAQPPSPWDCPFPFPVEPLLSAFLSPATCGFGPGACGGASDGIFGSRSATGCPFGAAAGAPQSAAGPGGAATAAAPSAAAAAPPPPRPEGRPMAVPAGPEEQQQKGGQQEEQKQREEKRDGADPRVDRASGHSGSSGGWMEIEADAE